MIETQNKEWGFFGTIWSNLRCSEKTARAAWGEAVKALTGAGYTEEEARLVLDGRLGRHIADQINRKSEVRSTLQDLVVRWAKDIASDAGRDPAGEKLAAEKRRAAQAKVEMLTLKHRTAAIKYARAADAVERMGIPTKELPRRERELQRAALALVEAIRESTQIP